MITSRLTCWLIRCLFLMISSLNQRRHPICPVDSSSHMTSLFCWLSMATICSENRISDVSHPRKSSLSSFDFWLANSVHECFLFPLVWLVSLNVVCWFEHSPHPFSARMSFVSCVMIKFANDPNSFIFWGSKQPHSICHVVTSAGFIDSLAIGEPESVRDYLIFEKNSNIGKVWLYLKRTL